MNTEGSSSPHQEESRAQNQLLRSGATVKAIVGVVPTSDNCYSLLPLVSLSVLARMWVSVYM